MPARRRLLATLGGIALPLAGCVARGSGTDDVAPSSAAVDAAAPDECSVSGPTADPRFEKPDPLTPDRVRSLVADYESTLLETAVRRKAPWKEYDYRLDSLATTVGGTKARRVDDGVLAAAWVVGHWIPSDRDHPERTHPARRAYSTAVYYATDRHLLRSERSRDVSTTAVTHDLAIEDPEMEEGTVVECW